MKVSEQIISSGTGGVLVAFLATPFDVVKTRLIAQTLHNHDRSCFYTYCKGVLNDVCITCGYAHPPKMVYRGTCQRELLYRGSLDAAIKISRSEGAWALWNGLAPTLFMIVPSAIVYFTTFDYLKKRGRDWMAEPYHEFVPSLAGITARGINVGLFSPIELVRTKAQSENQLNYGKLCDMIRKHIKTNGIRSLWDGSKSQLFRDVPFTVVYWYLQDKVRAKLVAQRDFGTVSSNICGAIVGASAATLISHPFDVAKTQQQSNIGLGNGATANSDKLLRYLVNIWRTDGAQGLFVGLLPRMVKLLPSCALMITTFEALKEYFEDRDRQQRESYD